MTSRLQLPISYVYTSRALVQLTRSMKLIPHNMQMSMLK